MLSCSIWFSAPSLWMNGGPESRCVGRVYGADGAVHGTIQTVSYFGILSFMGSILNYFNVFMWRYKSSGMLHRLYW